MTFKNYSKLMFHVVISVLLFLGPPLGVCSTAYVLNSPMWLIILLALVACFFSIFAGLRYICKQVDKGTFWDIF